MGNCIFSDCSKKLYKLSKLLEEDKCNESKCEKCFKRQSTHKLENENTSHLLCDNCIDNEITYYK
jgi:hypothetical protein